MTTTTENKIRFAKVNHYGFTATIDGYRWQVARHAYDGHWTAQVQKACTTDNGKSYFRYCTSYWFDTQEEMTRFATTQAAAEWA
jgi:hypothetical protein